MKLAAATAAISVIAKPRQPPCARKGGDAPADYGVIAIENVLLAERGGVAPSETVTV